MLLSLVHKVLYKIENMCHIRGMALRIASGLRWLERRIRRLLQRIEPAPAAPGASTGERELFDRRDLRARW